MGQIQFLLSPPEPIAAELLQFASMSGLDRTPWLVHSRIEGELLILDRSTSDSGTVTVPWPVEGHGLVALSTATLIERPEPYLLPLELARGTINLLRSQLFEWQMIGLSVPATVTEKLAEAIRLFSWAVIAQGDPAAPPQAQEAIRTAVDASQLLAAAYTEQAIATRRRPAGRLNSLLGGELPSAGLDEAAARQFVATFNAALVPILWRDVEASEGNRSWSIIDRQIEWCRAQGLKVCAGPLVQLDARGLPDWIYLWEDDYDSLLTAAGEFVEAAVKRYQGKVDLWICTARVNSAEVLSLSEEENLRLTACIIHLVRTLDPETPRTVSIDQPWGEYVGRRRMDFSPIHFADALVRARLDLRAILLEMNVGYFPGGTQPRTELEISRSLDYWSGLGLPLLVSLNMPSGDGEDPLAHRKAATPPGGWTLETQQAWAARYIPLILAKPNMHGVFWNQLSDSEPHDFPHAGLWDGSRQPKPALKTLTAIRQAYLTSR